MSWNLLKYKWARKMFWNSIKRLLFWAFLAWLGMFWVIDLPGFALDLIIPTIVVVAFLVGVLVNKLKG